MTKLKLFIFICFCVLSTITQAQYTLQLSDVTFSDGEITDYINTTEKNIIIPDNFNDVAVTSIGEEAFQDKQLTNVIIPNSVNSIGQSAFEDNQLTEVIIGNSVESIGENAFSFNELAEVIIGNSVESIGDNAFYENKLTQVIIPNSVTSIGESAFEDNDLTEVSIGNHVTSIGNYAFYGNQLTEVIIPDFVKSIGESAFDENKLTEVSIGNSVESIGEGAFIGNQLTEVIIPNSVKSIGDYAFDGNKLTEVSIGDHVTSIGNVAFYGNQLTNVSIPNSVKSIGEYAFSNNTGLTSFNLPTHYQGYSYPWSNGKKSGDEITDLALSYELDEDSKGNAVDFTISYTLDGGTNAANNPADYTVETATITLADASKDGYTFGGWYSEAAFTNQVTEIATGSTGPKEFFAKFSETYNITYTLDGGTNAANNPADYTVETATITLADASKDGYTFEGWYSDAAFTNQVTEIATGSTGTKKFFAKFSDAITYDIAYTLDGGTNDANNPADYTVETATITLADASKTGRTFKGWYSEAAFTNQVTEIATGSTGDISLYAKYSDEYTLQLSDVDFSDGEITAYTNTTEKNIIIPDNFNDVAVTFIGENAFQNNQLTQVSIPSSVTSIGKNAFSDNTGLTSFNLPAHYQGSSYSWSNGKKSGDEITDFALSYELDEDSKGNAVNFTITYTLDGGTNDANNPADYTVETATITLADASKDGYTFEGWYSDAAFTADNEVTEIATGSTGDVVLFAKYSEIALGIYTTNIKVFNFYPNPSIDFIQTELEVSSLTIRSISGSKVKQFEGGSFFDISNLKSGVYILLAIDKNGDTYKSKLLKE